MSFHTSIREYEVSMIKRKKNIMEQDINSLTLIQYDRDKGFIYDDPQYIQDEDVLLEFLDFVTMPSTPQNLDSGVTYYFMHKALQKYSFEFPRRLESCIQMCAIHTCFTGT